MFPKDRLAAMTANLRTYGSQFGLQFNNLEVLSSSHLSLIAGEFARDHGKFHEYHEAVFKAYFTEGEDIGKVEVISKILQKLNLEVNEFMSASKEGTYEYRLEQATSAAHINQINSTPTFIINDKYAVVGAQPLESFRKALLDMEKHNI
jgi:predicted DsbA family dithiol-disulfide isomerase